MAITLKLKPEIETQLLAQATQRGVSIEQLLETWSSQRDPDAFETRRNAMLDSAELD